MHAVRRSGGFTLVEVLVATALTLVVMAVTVTLFGNVTSRIAGSRAIIETVDRLRSCQERLILDLRGITAPMLPPLRPEWGLGYFEYVEGTWMASPIVAGTGNPSATPPVPPDTDTTVGDVDDLLMFTTRSSSDPFIGKFGATTAQSQVAEVAWFMRGTTLYRRVLLVLPGSALSTTNYYANNDISARQVGGDQDPEAGSPSSAILVANSLGDLTKRENRYAHEPRNLNDTALFGFPHGIGRWGQLGLPTLRECSSVDDPATTTINERWPFPLMPTGTAFPIFVRDLPLTNYGPFDYWTDPHPWTSDGTSTGTLIVEKSTGALRTYLGSRIAEDVILTNVISFDVRAWDSRAILFLKNGAPLGPGEPGYNPELTLYINWLSAYAAWVNGGMVGPAPVNPTTIVGHGAYVNLNYYGSSNVSDFVGPGNNSQLTAIYDTWSTHYESDGINQDQDGSTDEGTDGVDNSHRSGNTLDHPATATTFFAGGIDDATEREAPPPYSTPLRGIQVKIRVFEPDSRQIREVTITQDFLPE